MLFTVNEYVANLKVKKQIKGWELKDYYLYGSLKINNNYQLYLLMRNVMHHHYNLILNVGSIKFSKIFQYSSIKQPLIEIE